MLLFRKPTDDRIQSVLESQAGESFTYSAIGLSCQGTCPVGFRVNQSQTILGSGKADFIRAKESLLQWRMLNLGWLMTFPKDLKVEPGAEVAVVVRSAGVYLLNVARIIYLDDKVPSDRPELEAWFSFGYGTLPEYPLCGEERFAVTLDRETGDVGYEIFSFSSPIAWYAYVGKPMMIRTQKKFCRDSSLAMQQAIKE